MRTVRVVIGLGMRNGQDQARSAQVANASAAAASRGQPVPRRITSVVKVTASMSCWEGFDNACGGDGGDCGGGVGHRGVS